MGWIAGHYAGWPSDLGAPIWIFGGFALGLVRPPLGLIVTILVVPYAGADADPARSELFRVIPVLGAAVRVVLDRVRPPKPDYAPAGAVLGLAVLASALFIVSAVTPYLDDPNAESLVLAALPWLLGASVAFLAAWIVATHLSESSVGAVGPTVLASTVIACLVALAAWFGLPWIDPFVFAADVSGRLAAFGYAPPTGMAIAFALPIAVAVARRWHVLAAAGVLGLGLFVILLTGSRGPLLALGIGAFVGFAMSGRLNRATFATGALIAAVVGAWLVMSRYPGYSADQLVASFLAADSEDAIRVRSWFAAIEITTQNPLLGGGWRSLSRYHDVDLRGIGDSHNMILSAFANGGLPLGLAFGAVLLYSLRMLWTNRRNVPTYLLVAAITVLVAGLWDIPNLRSYGAVMGGLALGLVARGKPREVPTKRDRRPQRLSHEKGRSAPASHNGP